MELSLLKLLLDFEFYQNSSHIIKRELFPMEIASLYDTVSHCHSKYGKDLTEDELLALHLERNPALTEGAVDKITYLVEQIKDTPKPIPELMADVVRSAWVRSKAQEIADLAIEIFSGGEGALEDLQSLAIQAVNEVPSDTPETYTEEKGDLSDLLLENKDAYEFEFTLLALQDALPGMGRGDLMAVFARPEVGKSTFCSFLVAEYLKQGHTVAYFGNEEPARRVKLRIIQSFSRATREELQGDVRTYQEGFAPYKDQLAVFDCVGMDISEVDRYCELHRPAVVVIDQMDKVRVRGNFNRTDEKLKELYVRGREIAKRYHCLVVLVSQASAEAENRMFIHYDLMDSSKTGKPGEADVIVGIGKEFGMDVGERGIYLSKNKLTSRHDQMIFKLDAERGFYYD